MTDVSEEPLIEVLLRPSEIERLNLLVHQDLARVRGNQVMAEEKLSKSKLAGNIRKRAIDTINGTPHQRAVLEGAREALSEGMKICRQRGHRG